MTDLMSKARIVGQIVREISDELGCTVRFGFRQGDECIPEAHHTVTIEQHGVGLPAGHVMGSGSSPDKALGEAIARYEDATQRMAA